MPKLNDWKPGDAVQVLVVSPFKGGKTWGAGTFPRPNFIDFDFGIDTLRNPAWVAKYGKRDMLFEQFKETNRDARGVVKGHNAFDDSCRYFDACMSQKTVNWTYRGQTTPVNRDMFDTWVIDSGTSLSDVAANKAIVLLGTDDFAGAKSNTHQQALRHGLVVGKLQDYGAERSMVEQFVGMVKDTGKHLVLLCHEKVLTDDAGNVRSITPLLTGKSAQVVPTMFHEVYHLIVKRKGPDMVRELQTQPDTIRQCGSRIGVPNGTSWEWDALHAVIEKIRREQAQLATTPASAKP